jgi:hypothetical protein
MNAMYKLGAGSAWQRFTGTTLPNIGRTLFSTTPIPKDAGTFQTGSRVLSNAMRELTLGSPIDVYKDVQRLGTQAGKFNLGRGVKGLYRESLLPWTAANAAKVPASSFGKALHYGFGALPLAASGIQLYGAATSPENRGRNIGGAIAGLAAAPVTARLGIPGQLLLQAPITAAGRAVGGLFDRKRQQKSPAQQPEWWDQLPVATRDALIRSQGHEQYLYPPTS